MFTLRMKVKVTEYNIQNGAVRCLTSTSLKIIIQIFDLALSFWDWLFKFVTWKILVKVTEYNIRNDANQCWISTFINVLKCIFALALTFFKVLTFKFVT